MDKRAILAIILTFLVIFGWSILQSKLFPPEKPPQEISKRPSIEKKEVPQKVDIPKKEIKPAKGTIPVRAMKPIVKKEVTVETQNFIAVFTSEDARLKHFRLKKYRDRVEPSALVFRVVKFFRGLFGMEVKELKKPMPLDLVNTEEEELPLGITLKGFSSEGGWEVDKEKLQLLNPGEKGEITFVKVIDPHLKVFKRYRFNSEKYFMDLEIGLRNSSLNELTTQVGIEWIGKIELEKLADEENKDYGLKYAFFKNQKVERKELGGGGSAGCTPGCGSVKRRIDAFESSFQGEIKWYSFEGEYFTALLIPPATEKNLTLSVKGKEKNILEATLITSPFTIWANGSSNIPFRIYLGPKETDRLKELGVSAEKLVDFGFFTIIAKPLLWFLNLTNGLTKNFGIDIIILSILIKIIFLPLTQISFKSMKEMQKVQPEMARLKETYKNDKARLQQEIMLLYKRRKINPMSGCLPMLIQIPVFIALYNALQNAIEMRHAPFFLWIRDLSAKDPIYITPLIMGASMVVQQKMTPTAADPTQAKMFMLMPIMFTFLFLNFPSGLVLYWLVNNVLSIAHQYYLNKKG